MLALLLHERPFFQSKHLLLVAMIHGHLDRQDGIEVIAVPFHALVVYVASVLHRDELFVRQLCDVLHHCGHGKMYRLGNRAVAGMTLMGAAVFAVKQISIDRNSTMTDVQEEQFVGQREKVFASILEHGNHVLIQQSAAGHLRELLRDHVCAHVQLGRNLICAWHDKSFAVGVEIAEIGEDGKSPGLEVPLPDVIGEWKTVSCWIMRTEN